MTPKELSDRVGEIVTQAQSRVGPDSIGAQQYYVQGVPQKFETMPLSGLMTYYREELLDVINYAAMTIIRIDRIAAGLDLALTGHGYYIDHTPVIGDKEYTPHEQMG